MNIQKARKILFLKFSVVGGEYCQKSLGGFFLPYPVVAAMLAGTAKRYRPHCCNRYEVHSIFHLTLIVFIHYIVKCENPIMPVSALSLYKELRICFTDPRLVANI